VTAILQAQSEMAYLARDAEIFIVLAGEKEQLTETDQACDGTHQGNRTATVLALHPARLATSARPQHKLLLLLL
jgi:hypothetical protein